MSVLSQHFQLTSSFVSAILNVYHGRAANFCTLANFTDPVSCQVQHAYRDLHARRGNAQYSGFVPQTVEDIYENQACTPTRTYAACYDNSYLKH